MMTAEEFEARCKAQENWAPGWEAIDGRTEFIQLVGITEQELAALKADRTQAKRLYDAMRAENPFLVTDLNRVRSYL